MDSDRGARIELGVVVEASVEEAWAFVSEPGWYVNDGRVIDHSIVWDGADAAVTDPGHGTFVVHRETFDPPWYVRDRIVDGHGEVRRVEFWIVPGPHLELVVAESGLTPATSERAEDRRAWWEQHSRAWRHQLDLARHVLTIDDA